MKLNKTDKQVLTYLYKKYKQEHGSSKSMLNEFSIFILDNGLKNAVPELYGSDPELEKIKNIFKELSVRGLINIHGNNRHISLTETGFIEASKSYLEKTLELINLYPGIATVVAIASVIVGALALLK